MEPIAKSGLYYPNNLTRIFLFALEDIMGTNGLNAILNIANQSKLIGNFPPDNKESEFDFANLSSIIGAMDEMYGLRGGRILAMRAGYATFNQMRKDLGEPIDVNNETFQSKPLTEKMHVGLSLIRNTFSKTKTAAIPQTEDGQFLYSVQYCPTCWGRTTNTPACFLISGLLRASLRWATNGQEFDIKQITAHSCGASTCDFIVPITPIS